MGGSGGGLEKGEGSTSPVGSTDQGSSKAVTLAYLVGVDEPQIPLTVSTEGCPKDAIPLQIDHQGVDGALVAAGVHPHASDDLRAGLGTLLNQGAADSGADQGGNHGECAVDS